MEFGIDLGTTQSCIAYLDDTGRPTVVKSALGEDTTPSVVFFESSRHAVVGRAARDEALLTPDLVAQLGGDARLGLACAIPAWRDPARRRRLSASER